LADNEEVLSWIDSILKIGVNSDLISYLRHYEKDHNVMQGLLEMTSRVISNQYVTSKLVDLKTKEDIDNALKEYFGPDNKIKYNYILKQFPLVAARG
jgi:hypothetical protein